MNLKTLIISFGIFFFTNLASSQNNDPCTEIYGKWETYKIEPPFGMPPKNKSEIWQFDKNEIVIIQNNKLKYSLNSDCSKLIIPDLNNFSILKLTKDTLIIKLRILPHESYSIHFKKSN